MTSHLSLLNLSLPLTPFRLCKRLTLRGWSECLVWIGGRCLWSLSLSEAHYAGTYLYSQGGKGGRDWRRERDGRKGGMLCAWVISTTKRSFQSSFFFTSSWRAYVCAVCLALCSGMQGQPQVNTVFVHSMSKCRLMVCMLRHFPSGVVVITYVMCLTN